jgi:hypothetical protein
MKRIKPYDIYRKPSPVLRKISIRRQGTWLFASVPADKFVRETRSARFYLINEPFGLVRFDRTNPKKTSFRGLPGDYISRDSQGNLTLVTAEEYRRKFPIPDETVRYAPLTSEDYSKKPVEQTPPPSSNRSTSNSTSTGVPTNARPTNTRPSY